MIQTKNYTARYAKIPHLFSSSFTNLYKEDLELNLDEEVLEFLETVEGKGVYTFSQDWA